MTVYDEMSRLAYEDACFVLECCLLVHLTGQVRTNIQRCSCILSGLCNTRVVANAFSLLFKNE